MSRLNSISVHGLYSNLLKYGGRISNVGYFEDIIMVSVIVPDVDRVLSYVFVRV